MKTVMSLSKKTPYRKTRYLLTAMVLMPIISAAASNPPGYLPPNDQVQIAIQEQPDVRAAANLLNAASASRRALIAGSHEFQASIGAQRRNVTDEGRQYNEWEAQISRAIRLPGKAGLDREIGDSTQLVAELKLSDAEHVAARRLLELWMGWLQTSAQARELTGQQKLLDRERKALSLRILRGDAAQRELDVMQAEYATLTSHVLSVQSAANIARQKLESTFPTLTVPEPPPELPEPEPLPNGLEAWKERIIQESAEIAIARNEWTRQSLVAARTRAERTPDPTIGVRAMSERGGAEKVVGLVLSIPFGTDYRSAEAERETANASAALMDASRVQRAIEQSAWIKVQTAASTYAQWQSSQQALKAQYSAATKTKRAWELGEAPLAEYLLAARNLRQAQLDEANARINALRSALDVRIDAHALWHSGAHQKRPQLDSSTRGNSAAMP
jgi:outer membrane protein TolC